MRVLTTAFCLFPTGASVSAGASGPDGAAAASGGRSLGMPVGLSEKLAKKAAALVNVPPGAREGCPICLTEQAADVQLAPCGHLVCHACITEWAEVSASLSEDTPECLPHQVQASYAVTI
jgi:hypothetical protein